MLKLSAALAAIGLGLLAWSFAPSPASRTTAAVTATAVTADVAIGRALFTAKGCATCHINWRALESPGDCCAGVGPDLTAYTNDPAFLGSAHKRWVNCRSW